MQALRSRQIPHEVNPFQSCFKPRISDYAESERISSTVATNSAYSESISIMFSCESTVFSPRRYRNLAPVPPPLRRRVHLLRFKAKFQLFFLSSVVEIGDPVIAVNGKPYRIEYAESALPAYRIEYALLYYRSGGLAAGWPRA